ncbi:DUF3305 domain-containing protein [Stappia sp. F7233]|uniref:DUF3305 domain-containing protein n=1 Tax=Stappia albiluteola TaxID=2758565 RepID=A0A839AAE9_9HYPH|nr:DUF3305 domain-containing protein [Stappia albiluteola]MBA5776630.1 DUF3305 domain-containing protein [Stappia albiluteola]
MAKEVSRQFGVVLQRRPAVSKWADWVWSVADIVPDAPATDGWREIAREGDVVRYMNAPFTATLYEKMVEAYDSNIETGQPAIWVALAENDAGDPPWRVIGVTVDPYQAQSWQEAGEGLVERIALAPDAVAWMARFLQEVPEAPAFRKRRRDSAKVEEPQFGKTPIFSPEHRRSEQD